jgi:phosphoribosyl 1,2-cyclic phosphodiesterase
VKATLHWVSAAHAVEAEVRLYDHLLSASACDFTICSLASGSRGNATYISDGTTAILIDAGLSGLEIERRMRSRGLSPADLTGLVVSHEHADHIRGVGILARRYRLPVHITRRTRAAAENKMGRIDAVHHFECGRGFTIGTLDLHPFSTSHDAEESSGFTLRRNGTKIGIATDLGIATAVVRDHLRECSLILLEANHDPDMLINGPYPWYLKQRIKGRTGHLSNEDAGLLLREVLHDRLQHVLLSHLSEKNNTPEKALGAVGPALNGSRARLSVSLQDVCGELILV